MLGRLAEWDAVACSATLAAMGRAPEAFGAVKALVAEMARRGVPADGVVRTAVVSAAEKAGEWEYALAQLGGGSWGQLDRVAVNAALQACFAFLEPGDLGTVVAAFFVSDVALASAAHTASTAALRAGGRRRTPLAAATDIITAV